MEAEQKDLRFKQNENIQHLFFFIAFKNILSGICMSQRMGNKETKETKE